MRLMTKALEKRFAKLGSQVDVEDPIVVAKFFNPVGAGTWYAISFEPRQRLLFGYVSIFGDFNDEWGYFSLDDLESLKLPLGLGIERDLYWIEKRASEVISKG